ncbi:MORC family CW-type zinc finger protein 1 [Bienertia sinuspersici]
MRGLTSQSLAKAFKEQLYPLQKPWGGIASLEPKKKVADEKVAEAVVAFSRPPPFYPIFGPLVALSCLDSWSKKNNNEDA